MNNSGELVNIMHKFLRIPLMKEALTRCCSEENQPVDTLSEIFPQPCSNPCRSFGRDTSEILARSPFEIFEGSPSQHPVRSQVSHVY
jgi:hypothetical protein